MTIIETIGEPALLEQLAEECSELAQAALKLARKMRDENPTPKTKEECIADLEEELADVMVVVKCMHDATWLNSQKINEKMAEKDARWKQRLKESEPPYWKHVFMKSTYGGKGTSMNLCSKCNHAQKTTTPFCGGCGRRIRGVKNG